MIIIVYQCNCNSLTFVHNIIITMFIYDNYQQYNYDNVANIMIVIIFIYDDY